MPAQRALILFAHGARDPQWAEPFQRLAALLQDRQTESRVSLAFLELMTPSLADCVAEQVAAGITHITIVPAFMARGSHLRRDLPLLIEELAARHPQIELQVTAALGEAEPVLAAMADWIASQ
ncbi:sirohydrochlorin chelatase [Chitinimonas taiwanensis]|uniref:Sirohydrochlorin cobaltochelatase n=1 Tax=Chitinimonas taiwanensis DSM 18899 TaxID=1121279 RepID=A0A1K2HBD9_9NEIS|nr:CbiX/SirB N-terminal domain-containing protein [Chitinimonas taiwanensis]SFZ74132.1 sirohydrochlorin cobaltochelatase [Chitinimonas taiwanensis DSM 18899]